jgi:geranylgeranyl pyrophosphate synthase
VGALLGGGDGEEIERMGNYGQYLGMAFQIEDDLLNIMGDPERVGKPWGGDLRRGKSTLPIAYALRGLKELEIEKLLTSPEKELLALVKDSGSLEYSQKVARSLVESAKRNLKVVEGEEERAALELIADYAVGREE